MLGDEKHVENLALSYEANREAQGKWDLKEEAVHGQHRSEANHELTAC